MDKKPVDNRENRPRESACPEDVTAQVTGERSLNRPGRCTEPPEKVKCLVRSVKGTLKKPRTRQP